MTYDELPLINIEAKRGEDATVVFTGISVDGVSKNFTDLCPKIEFKPAVDSLRPSSIELTEENGGLTIEPNRLTMFFNGRDLNRLAISTYYGDLLMTIDGVNIVGPRFKLNLTGTVTTKTKDEC